jgi:hypothetical protein
MMKNDKTSIQMTPIHSNKSHSIDMPEIDPKPLASDTSNCIEKCFKQHPCIQYTYYTLGTVLLLGGIYVLAAKPFEETESEVSGAVLIVAGASIIILAWVATKQGSQLLEINQSLMKDIEEKKQLISKHGSQLTEQKSNISKLTSENSSLKEEIQKLTSTEAQLGEAIKKSQEIHDEQEKLLQERANLLNEQQAKIENLETVQAEKSDCLTKIQQMTHIQEYKHLADQVKSIKPDSGDLEANVLKLQVFITNHNLANG